MQSIFSLIIMLAVNFYSMRTHADSLSISQGNSPSEQSGVQQYWTPERLRSAKPFPNTLPVVPPSDQDLPKSNTVVGKDGSAPAEPASTGRKVNCVPGTSQGNPVQKP